MLSGPPSGGGSGGSTPTSPAGGSSPSPAAGNPALGGSTHIPLVHNPDGTITSTDPAWKHLIDRESGGRNIGQQITDSNGGPGSPNAAQGYFQITPATWKANGGEKYGPSPMGATAEQQAEIAEAIFRKNPSGSDWGAGLSGREDPAALQRALQQQQR